MLNSLAPGARRSIAKGGRRKYFEAAVIWPYNERYAVHISIWVGNATQQRDYCSKFQFD